MIKAPLTKNLFACPALIALGLVVLGYQANAVAGNANEQLRAKGFDDEWVRSLTSRGEPRVYSGDELQYIGQPVGGQYAGQVYLGGDGRLWYWDIFNQRVVDPGGSGDKFYNTPMRPDEYRSVSQGFMLTLTGDHDTKTVPLDGRAFADVRFRSEYPIARVALRDHNIPVQVDLECFSPFCPTNSADSGFPAVIMAYEVKNTSNSSLNIAIGGWLENATNRQIRTDKPNEVTATHGPIPGIAGVSLSAEGGAPAADAGSMAIANIGDTGHVLDDAPKQWVAALQAIDGHPIPEGSGIVQTDEVTLGPGASAEFRFVISWYFPNGQLGALFPGPLVRRDKQRNFYSKRFANAGEVIQEIGRRQQELIDTTRLWTKTWYDSTLPYWFLGRTFINASTLATTAAIRLHDPGDSRLDGRVYFWEGVYLGPGTCTHVTHYEQAFGRLFPDAARAQRKITDFHVGWDDELGYVQYRAEWNVGHHFGIPHAIDGHAGTILRTYREHTTSSDNSFLQSLWPRVKRATQFMIDQDSGRGFFADKVPRESADSFPDGILDGPQYHTLDKYWNGIIPWHSGMYMASLRASAAMARDIGDDEFAAECDRIADVGGPKLTDSNFSEEAGYYIHTPNQEAEYLVNTNRGCHIDQLLGDYWTSQVALSRVFPSAETRSTLGKLFEHNFYSRIGDYRKDAAIPCVRFYCDDDEPGFLMCTFPNGGANEAVPPSTEGWDALVVGYFSECMTGFTYQVASHMISEGMITEGLALCRAIHDRYAESPLDRNPFNEIEYGNHYTRAMSSYGAYISATGFEYHGPRGHLGFSPKIHPEELRAAFTAAEGWGTIAQSRKASEQRQVISVAWGKVYLKTLNFVLAPEFQAMTLGVKINGNSVGASYTRDGEQVVVELAEGVELATDDTLEIRFEAP